MSLVPFV